MRALIYTIPATAKLFRDSQFLLCFDLAEALVDHHEHHVYLALPGRYQEAWNERFPNGRKGITVVFDPDISKYRFLDRFRMGDPRFIADHFSRRYGVYPVDWVYVTEPEPVGLLRTCISETNLTYTRPVPIFAQELGVISEPDESARRDFIDEAVSMHRGFNYLQAHPIYFTQMEQERAEKEYSRWLSPYGLREMRKRTMIRPVMLAEDRIEPYRGSKPKFEKFTALYGGRLSVGKQPDAIFEILHTAFATGGANFDVRVCAPNKSLHNAIQRKIATAFGNRVIVGAEREQFWDIAQQCHAAIATSAYESFGIGFFELLHLGLPVLIPRAPWSEGIYPEWYPWWYGYRDTTEAVTLLHRIRDTYDTPGFKAQMRKVQAWVQDYVGREPLMAQLMRSVRGELTPAPKEPRSIYTPLSGPGRDLLWKAVHALRGKRAPLKTIIRFMAKLGRSFSEEHRVRFRDLHLPTDYDIHCTLTREWGLVDDVSRSTPTYHIAHDFTPPDMG